MTGVPLFSMEDVRRATIGERNAQGGNDLLVMRYEHLRDEKDRGLLLRIFPLGEADVNGPSLSAHVAADPIKLSRAHQNCLPWNTDRVIAYSGPALIQGNYLFLPATAEDIKEYVLQSPSD